MDSDHFIWFIPIILPGGFRSFYLADSDHFTLWIQIILPGGSRPFYLVVPILNSYDTVLWVDSIVDIIQIPNPKNNVEPELVTINHPWNRWLHDEIKDSIDARYKNYQSGLQKQRQIYENINWVPHTCFIISRRTPNVIKYSIKKIYPAINYSRVY